MSDIILSIRQRASAYLERVKTGDSALYDMISSRIRPFLHETDDVLELACGMGLLSRRLTSAVHFLEASDPSESVIKSASKTSYGPSLHFSVLDPSALPFDEETFDVVVANELHRMKDPEKALSESRRVLRPAGLLIAPVYVRENGGKTGRETLLASFTAFRKKSRFSEEDFLSFLKEKGFTPVHHELIRNGQNLPVCLVVAKHGPDRPEK